MFFVPITRLIFSNFLLAEPPFSDDITFPQGFSVRATASLPLQSLYHRAGTWLKPTISHLISSGHPPVDPLPNKWNQKLLDPVINAKAPGEMRCGVRGV